MTRQKQALDSSLFPFSPEFSRARRLKKQNDRLAALFDVVQRSSPVTTEELSNKLEICCRTVRHDLELLARNGLIRRTYGGAESLQPLFYEPFRREVSFQARATCFSEEKRRIGDAASALISPGDTIALSPGTTTREVIRALPLNWNIKIVTNAINLAMELSYRKDIDVFLTGGQMVGDWFSLAVPDAAEIPGNALISIFFIGADGVDAASGLSCFHPEAD